ncbi:MAG TPA: hypothetical protein VFO84_03880 [Dehalococcoidia bacterium]|nr:hypothetical protein [Dehalococcoidia bacterium]
MKAARQIDSGTEMIARAAQGFYSALVLLLLLVILAAFIEL